MSEKTDARIAKTTDKLRKALLELMTAQPVDSITVTSLCKAAGINRNTFYAHYNEPVDLLNEIENGLLSIMWNTLSQVDASMLDIKAFVRSIIHTIASYKDVCYVILSDHGNRHFVSQIVDMLHDKTTGIWIQKGMTEEEADVTYHYCVAGALGVIENWVKSGYKIGSDELADMLSDLIESGQIRNISRY